MSSDERKHGACGHAWRVALAAAVLALAGCSPAEPVPVPPLIDVPKLGVVIPTSSRDAVELLTRAVVIGDPNRKRFPRDNGADAFARSVRDLQVYEGRIYVGCGDWNANRGPIDIWSFGPAGPGRAADFRKEYRVADESVDRFRVCNDTLLVPGIDATGWWHRGNLYFKRGGEWTQRRTVPGAIHVLDATILNGTLYAATGTRKGARLFASGDDGKTWRMCGTAGQCASAGGRFYALAPLGGGLLVCPASSAEVTYHYANGRLRAYRLPLFGLPPGRRSWRIPHRMTPFGSGVLYTSWAFAVSEHSPQPLMLLSSLERGPDIVEQFRAANVRDILVRNGQCHVLTARATQAGPAAAYEGGIYTSTNLKDWTRIAAFTVPAIPNAMELLEGVYYIGLSHPSPEAPNPASGKICRLVQ